MIGAGRNLSRRWISRLVREEEVRLSRSREYRFISSTSSCNWRNSNNDQGGGQWRTKGKTKTDTKRHRNNGNESSMNRVGKRKDDDGISSLRDAFLQSQTWRNQGEGSNNNSSSSKAFRERTKPRADSRSRSRSRPNNKFPNHRQNNNNSRSIADLQRSLLGGEGNNKTPTLSQQDTNATAASDDASGNDQVVGMGRKKSKYSWMELSRLWKVKVSKLQELASLTTRTRFVDIDTVELLALELNLELNYSSTGSHGDTDNLVKRPPVVCIMGHVDHGKTTLLDALRQLSYSTTTATSKNTSKITAMGKKSKKSKKKKGQLTTPTAPKVVAGTEAGGITQAISAFVVPFVDPDADANENENDTSTTTTVTFLDTPGHAAFRSMRECSSLGADIVVLVIAAKDGISEQTEEILKHLSSSNNDQLEVVIAMTKADMIADITNNEEESIIIIDDYVQQLEQQISNFLFLHSHDNVEVPMIVPTSAKYNYGLQDLLETISVLGSDYYCDNDNLEDPSSKAIVLDAQKHSKFGILADCILRDGQTSVGDYYCLSSTSKNNDANSDADTTTAMMGKVRNLLELSTSKPIRNRKAGPSQPIRVIGGFSSIPKPGDTLLFYQTEQQAKRYYDLYFSKQQSSADNNATNTNASTHDQDVTQMELQVTGVEAKQNYMRQQRLHRYNRSDDDLDADNDDTNDAASRNSIISIPIVLVADTNHTLEALRDCVVSLQELNDNIRIQVISTNVSPTITPNDIRIATDANAPIFGFNVPTVNNQPNLTLECDSVIYRILDRAKEIFGTFLPPIPTTVVHGEAKIQMLYTINKNDTAIGCIVQEGTLYHQQKQKKQSASHSDTSTAYYYRLLRDDNVIMDESTCTSLRHVKEVVTSVRRGEECGIVLSTEFDYQINDILQCYSMEMKHTKL